GEASGAGEKLAELVAKDLGVEELLRVLPLVESFRLVESFVALESHHRPPGGGRGGARELGLADSGRPLDEDGPLEGEREKKRGRDLRGRNVSGGGERGRDGLGRGHEAIVARGC